MVIRILYRILKAVRVKFGVGAVDEPGYEIKAFGAKNVLMIAVKATNLVLTHGGGEKIPAPCRPLIATPRLRLDIAYISCLN